MDHRLDLRAPINMLLNKFVDGTPRVCRASNISRSGLLLHKLLEPELPQSVVGLQFQLPGQDRIITAAGRVVYEHPWLRALGVRFTNLADEHRALIEHYILDALDWKRALEGARAG
ncbi:MAG TPA: PilZ domain-containing protein [Polyangia bacterium]|nr:PilZ domain-containing protein [Polyangia bacterium]